MSSHLSAPTASPDGTVVESELDSRESDYLRALMRARAERTEPLWPRMSVELKARRRYDPDGLVSDLDLARAVAGRRDRPFRDSARRQLRIWTDTRGGDAA